MRAAVVDDTSYDAERVKRYLERFCKESDIQLEIACFSDAERFLSERSSGWELVIMDIDMPGLNGVEAAKVLRRTDPDVVLMFVTNMPQYALAGYEVEAVDYVLKPIAYQDFSLKLRKALRYIRRNRDVRISVQSTEGLVRLSVREITYVESMLHYLIYHTRDGSYRARQTMSEAENSLQTYGFARCNSSYLVNLRHVQAIEKGDVVVDNARLKMSRGRQPAFLDRFAQFLGGMDE